MWYHEDLLSKDALDQILNYYQLRNFQCGSVSNPDTKTKQCLQMKYNPEYQSASKILQGEFDKDHFYARNLIKTTSQYTFGWYRDGDFYDWHIDKYPVGQIWADMSMTIFLNDDYEGGELVVKVGDYDTLHKPKPGTAVMYNTGLMHKVNPVTKGERKVVILWFESMVRDPVMRDHIRSLGKCVREIEDDHPLFMTLAQQRLNMLRQYGRY